MRAGIEYEKDGGRWCCVVDRGHLKVVKRMIAVQTANLSNERMNKLKMEAVEAV